MQASTDEIGNFWRLRLTQEQQNDEAKLQALDNILFGSPEEVVQYRGLHPDLSQLMDEYQQTRIPEFRNTIEATLTEQRRQLVADIEPRYEALINRLVRSFNYDEFVRRCGSDENTSDYYLGVLTNSILFQMDRLDSNFSPTDEAERCEFLEYRFQSAQQLFARLNRDYPDLILDEPQALPNDKEIAESATFYEIARTMDDAEVDSEYSQYFKLYIKFKFDHDFHPPTDDRPNSLVWSTNRLTPSDQERLKQYPLALVAMHKALVAERQRLAEYGVVKRDLEHTPNPESLRINTESPVIVTGLQELNGHVLLVTEADVPDLLKSFYIDPNSEEGKIITYERIAKMIPDHFIEGIDEIMFLNPEVSDQDLETTVKAEASEIEAGYSQEELNTRKRIYLGKTRATLTHEVFEHAKYKFSLDELQGFMEAINTDDQRTAKRISPLNITIYIRFLRENIDIFGAARIAREDLCETAKLYVNEPATLNHIAPNRYQFMLNLFTTYMPENWRQAYQEAQRRALEYSKLIQKVSNVDDEQLTDQILEHEKSPKEEVVIPRDEHGKITGPNTNFSVSGEYIITDVNGFTPQGKIVIHRPPYLRVVEPITS